jgi:hypothetical protein
MSTASRSVRPLRPRPAPTGICEKIWRKHKSFILQVVKDLSRENAIHSRPPLPPKLKTCVILLVVEDGEGSRRSVGFGAGAILFACKQSKFPHSAGRLAVISFIGGNETSRLISPTPEGGASRRLLVGSGQGRRRRAAGTCDETTVRHPPTRAHETVASVPRARGSVRGDLGSDRGSRSAVAADRSRDADSPGRLHLYRTAQVEAGQSHPTRGLPGIRPPA